MPAVRRLLTIGHSYVLGVNRRLAHSIRAAGAGRWEVVVAAPTRFHGQRDLRPAVLDAGARETDAVVALDAHLTREVHLFFYGARLRGLERAARFSWSAVGSRYVELFDALLSPAPARSA